MTFRAGLGLAALLFTTTPLLAAEGHRWGYEGEGGPNHWGEISEEFAACATGASQSPIDIVPTNAVAAAVSPVETNWQAFIPTVVNNGHTIQANTNGQGGYAMLDGKRYDLLQFHFHHQSEHTINGQHAPMEVHFVHKSEAGDLLVLGVMLQAGTANPAIGSVWSTAPAAGNETVASGTIDISGLLPATSTSFRYQGSLTTPPCSEIVTWNVYAEPAQLSQEQIDTFGTLYPNDARPVQPLNRRFILSDAS
ncbi:MAG: carbonic anhydrase [Devosia sp.]